MKILKLAPPSGNDVTFIVNVCASRLDAPSATRAASRTKGQADPEPATKSSHDETELVWANTLNEVTVNTANKSVLKLCKSPETEQFLV